MRNLALLIRKDFISAFAAYGFYAVFLVVWFFIVAFVPTSASFLYIMVIYVFVVSLFNTEENELVCNVAGILPIRKSQVVVARYLYTYLILLVETVLASIACPLVARLRGVPVAWVAPVMLALATSLLMVSIIAPLAYKFGVVKMRALILVVYVVMIIAGSSLSPIFNEIFPPVSALYTALIMVVSAFALSLISLAISVRIKR